MRIRGVSGGLLGVLSEFTQRAEFEPQVFSGLDNATNLHFQGQRDTADLIVLP